MNTFLSEIDQKCKQEFEQFAQQKLAPIASAIANRSQSPSAFFKQLAQLGYLGLNIPSEYGGKDSPFLHVVLLAEALAHYDPGVVLCLAYHIAAIELIKEYGSPEQKSTYLAQLAKGNLIGTVAHIEESAGKVLLVSHESITGKTPNNDNLVLLFAADNFFLLGSLEQLGLTVRERPLTMGLCSAHFSDLSFEKEMLKNQVRLQHSDKSAQLLFARDIVKTVLAATAIGISQSALNQAVAHAKQGQRNNAPLAQSEAIQWKLADAAVETSAARLLVYRAAWSKDEDKEHFPSQATMAKAYAARVARYHSSEGLQILLPLLNEPQSSLTRFYLDSKMLETFEITNEEEKVLLSDLLGI